MTINLNFANLEPHVQDKFIAVARKDPEGRTAAEWFEHLVPEKLQDSSYETEVFMDGGTVTREEWVYDQGRGGGHYETVEYDIGDRDVSRIESGHNGGEYTHDNTIMEDSSINRSRGAEDMTDAEFDVAAEANTVDADIINGAIEPVETITTTTSEVFNGFEFLGEVLGTAAGVYTSYRVGKAVHKAVPSQEYKTPIALATSGGLFALAVLNPIGGTLMTFAAAGLLTKTMVDACVKMQNVE